MQDPTQIAIAGFLATSRQALFGNLRDSSVARIAVVPRVFLPKRLFAGVGRYLVGLAGPLPRRRPAGS
ncbi:MAG: hypothetical protein KF778_19365 [Rhodocyclaceae bacterium]|nr:hypothetical protein [Rhodocyclaceae bacterium]MBX3670568.1 hypothetical protein [Rhodocyclaceae bacterium]